MTTLDVFTPWQCRQVRRLLGWSLGRLAEETNLKVEFLGFYEAGLRYLWSQKQIAELAPIGEAFARAGINAHPRDLAKSGAELG